MVRPIEAAKRRKTSRVRSSESGGILFGIDDVAGDASPSIRNVRLGDGADA